MPEQSNQSLSWEYKDQEKRDEGSRLAKILGIGTLIGASFFPGSESFAQERQQAPAAAHHRVDRALEATYQEISRPEDVLKIFDTKTHVYVSRNPDTRELPVSERQLQELASFLAATDHYLVIIGKAQGYQYTTPSGERLSGKEAIWVMLGQKLFDNEKFASVTDNRTDPPAKSASLLILTCDPGQGNPDRDWWMSTSALHEKFGISDENDWKSGARYGHMAIPSFQRRQFFEGVRDTVQRIDRDLGEKIRIEREREEQARINANLAVTGAGQLLGEYRTRLADLNTRFPGRTGELLSPGDMEQLAQRLDAGKRALESKDWAGASSLGGALKSNLGERIKALVEYPGAGTRLEGLATELEQAAKHEFAFSVRGQFQQASGILDEAKTRWERGESAYVPSLGQAEKSLRDLKGALADALKTYNMHGEKITNLIDRTSELSKSEHASVAGNELKLVGEKLERVRKMWAGKDPAYPEVLRQAEVEVDQAALKIVGAENAAARSRTIWGVALGLSGLLSLGGLIAGVMRNRAVRRRGEEAKDKLDKLKEGMSKKEEGLEALERLKEKALSANGSPISFTPGQESAKLAKDAKDAIEKLWLFQVVGNEEITKQAQDLIGKGGLFSTRNFDEAIQTMADKPVEFSDKNKEKIKKAFSELKSGLAALTVPIEKLADFKKSMQEIDQEYMRLSQLAESGLRKILTARENIGAGLDRIDTAVAKFGLAADTLREFARADRHPTGSGLFVPPALDQTLAPALKGERNKIASLQQGDPSSAWDRCSQVLAVAGTVESAVETVIQKRSSAVPGLRAVEQTLSENGLKPAWIASELKGISDRVAQYVADMAVVATSDRPAASGLELREMFQSLHERADRAVMLDAERRGRGTEMLAGTKTLVEQTRKDLGGKLGLEPAKILQEQDSDPDLFLIAADKAAAGVVTALDSGQLDQANTCLGEIYEACATVDRIVRATKESFASHDELVSQRNSKSDDLKRALPAHEASLDAIVNGYAQEVLAFRSDDKVYAKADSSVHNNIEEAREGIRLGDEACASAQSLFTQGKILEAAYELSRSEECYRFSADRLQEIDDKKGRLAETEKANERAFAELGGLHGNLGKQIDSDLRIMHPTVTLFRDEATKVLERAGELQALQRTDPFAIQEALSSARAALETVGKAIASDRDIHSEAKRSMELAGQRLAEADRVSQRVDANEVPDSHKTDEAQEKVDLLGVEYKRLKQRFEKPERGDWYEFDREADRIVGAVENNLKTIEAEDTRGREAMRRLEAASRAVREADGWTGMYGISVSGNPGLDGLRRAKTFLRSGEYDQVVAWAASAAAEAKRAIEQAQAAIAAETARREAARRQREAEEAARLERLRKSQSSSSGGGSPFGGFGGRSSGGSGGFGGFGGRSSGGTGVGGW